MSENNLIVFEEIAPSFNCNLSSRARRAKGIVVAHSGRNNLIPYYQAERAFIKRATEAKAFGAGGTALFGTRAIKLAEG